MSSLIVLLFILLIAIRPIGDLPMTAESTSALSSRMSVVVRQANDIAAVALWGTGKTPWCGKVEPPTPPPLAIALAHIQAKCFHRPVR
jgi:hypothetical protein